MVSSRAATYGGLGRSRQCAARTPSRGRAPRHRPRRASADAGWRGPGRPQDAPPPLLGRDRGQLREPRQQGPLRCLPKACRRVAPLLDQVIVDEPHGHSRCWTVVLASPHPRAQRREVPPAPGSAVRRGHAHRSRRGNGMTFEGSSRCARGAAVGEVKHYSRGSLARSLQRIAQRPDRSA